jgi:hypothetical protein
MPLLSRSSRSFGKNTNSQITDVFAKNTIISISGDTPSISYNTDASVINNTITPAGQVRPTGLHPFAGDGYYSTYFAPYGGSIIATPSAEFTLGTQDFTIEGWFYYTGAVGDTRYLFDFRPAGASSAAPFLYIVTGKYTYWVNNTIVASGGAPAIHTWVHLALVKTAGSTKLYVDGSVVFKYTDSINYTGTTNLRIGEAWRGIISNFRIVKGQALYKGPFFRSDEPLTLTSQGITNGTVSLLTCQSNRLIDNSPNNHTLTRAYSDYDGQVLSENPFPPLEKNKNIGSAVFNGADYLTLASSPTFNIFNGDMTVECWFFATSLTLAPHIFAFVQDASNRVSIYFNSGALTFYSASSAGSGNRIATSELFLNTWYHVALVKSGATFTLYLNGTSIGTSSTTQYSTSNQSLQIGTYNSGGYAGDNFKGYITNVRIVKGTAVYTSAFTPSREPLTAIPNTVLLTLQTNLVNNNLSFYDRSNYRSTILATGSVTQTTTHPFGSNWSNYFNGTSYLTIPSNAAFAFGTGDYTVEAWVYFTGINSYDLQIIFQSGTTGGNNFSCHVDANQISVSTTAEYISNQTSSFSTNTWYHIAFCRSSGTLRLFKDGTQQGSSVTDSTNWTSSGSAVIGANEIATQTVFGYISNLRVVKGTAVYTGNFIPSKRSLSLTQSASVNVTSLVPANISLLTCQSNRLIDTSPNNFALTLVGSVSINKFSPFDNYFASSNNAYSSKPITYSPNTFGGSVYFDGSGDYLTVAENVQQRLANTFTIQGWFNATSKIAANIAIVSKGTATTGWQVMVGTANTLLFTNATTTLATTTPIKFNEWNHFAVVRQSNNRALVFLNGNLEVTGTVTDPFGSDYTNPGTSNIYIGSGRIAGANVFTGFIGGIQIDGVDLYSNNFVLPFYDTKPLGSAVFSLDSKPIIINDADQSTLLASTDTSIRNFTPHAPEGYYSNYFNGSTSYLSIPNNSGFALGTNNFCIEGWYYPISNTVYQALIAKRPDQDATGSYVIYSTQNSNALKFYASSNGSSFDIIVDGIIGTTVNNTWNHFAVYRIGNIFYGSLNGVVTNMGTSSSSFYVDSSPLYIGGEQKAGTPGNVINGYLTNIRIVNGSSVYTSGAFTPSTTPLTAIANTSLLTCQSRNFRDNSLNSFPLTINAGVAVRNDNPFSNISPYTGQSIYFDGTGNAIRTMLNDNFNSIPAGANVTMEAWIYPQATDKSLWALGNEGDGSNRLAVAFQNNMSLYVNVYQQGTTYFDVIQTNAWSHVAITRQNNVVYGYINGIRQTNTDTRYTTLGNNGPIKIGGDNSGTYYNFVGYMKDFRITRDVARYTANTVPPSKFTPAKSYAFPFPEYKTRPIEYLVVAGGGGAPGAVPNGGGVGGGGGGAGGLITSRISLIDSKTYVVTVGAGGEGGVGTSPSTNGSISSISRIATAIGGGAGAIYVSGPSNGSPGGSGGGALTGGGGGLGYGGLGIFEQGNHGGNTTVTATTGGGGGAGKVADVTTPPTYGYGGDGGFGVISFISGSNLYYAGGGGGATDTYFYYNPALNYRSNGGAGGGGAGGNNITNAVSGGINTGGGGGGSAQYYDPLPTPSTRTGGSGGSGVVIIRHPDTFLEARTTTGSPNVIYANANIIYRFWQSGTITFT